MVEKNKAVMILVSTAVTLILAIALISSIAEEGQRKTTLTDASNELITVSGGRMEGGAFNVSNPANNHTLTYVRTSWKAEDSDCVITITAFGNSSNKTMLIADTDYTLYQPGIVKMLNNTRTVYTMNTNSTYITYRYCADDYISENWARTILNMVPGLIALAILVVAVIASVLLGKRGEED